jgi:hypothetical protein
MTDAGRDGTTELRYRLNGYSGNAADAHIQIRSFDRPARVKRAAVGLATWWAVAIGCVFIPVAHFFLVPGFLIFGMVTFVQRLKTAAVVVAARGTCPDCGADQDLDMLGPWRGPQDVSCRQCHRSLQLSEGDDSP